jgi:dGTP triphosphohydrolase
MSDIEALKKCAKCVYLACDKEVADDIAGHLNAAADEITTLQSKLDSANKVIEQQKAELQVVEQVVAKKVYGVFINEIHAAKHFRMDKYVDQLEALLSTIKAFIEDVPKADAAQLNQSEATK